MKYLSAKKIYVNLLSVFLLLVILLPLVLFAQTRVKVGLVPCGNARGVPCDFTYFIMMINNIIDWLIKMATVIFALMCVWGGWLYMTSGQNPGNVSKARSVLLNTMAGFVIILIAWVVVKTILVTLVDDGQLGIISTFLGKLK